MKRLALFFLMASSSLLRSGTIYPMEGGTLRRENHSIDLTITSLPLTVVWTGANCESEPCSNPIILSDRVIQTTRVGVIARARCDGHTIWSWPDALVGLLWNPSVYDTTRDLLYQSTISGAVIALSPETGQPQWSIYEGANPSVNNLSSVTYYNNMIYYGNANQSFVCINADTHAQIWRFNFSQAQGCVTPAIDGGFIYIAGTRGEIACLNASTGVVQWDIQTSCFRSYASAILLNNTNLYVMSNTGLVECRNRTSGAVQWTFQTGSYSLANLSIGDELYCSSDDRCVYKLDLNTGAVDWRDCFTGNFARSGPYYCGGEIFASGCANFYYGVDSNGNTNFAYNEGTDNSFTDWAEADGLLYVTNRTGVMTCFAFSGVSAFPNCTPSFTASTTLSPTLSPSPSASPSATSTPSATLTLSFSPSPSGPPCPTVTVTATRTPTPSPSPTISPTPSMSPDFSPSPTLPPDAVPPGNNPGDPGPGGTTLYPNPVHSSCHFVFEMSGPGSSRVRVYRADGTLCGDYSYQHSSGGLKDVSCDMSSYAPGVYFFLVDRDCGNGRTDTTSLDKFIVLK